MAFEEAELRVTVIYCPAPREVRELELNLPEGSTASDALVQADWFPLDDAALPSLPTNLTLGLWGRNTVMSQTLRDGDRLEILRPLQVDPKIARRERFSQQGAKTAGLFANRRVGAKSGY